MKVVYISGAYRSDSVNGIYENIQKAREVAIKYWKLGYAVICPHMNTAFMDGACNDHIWLEGDIEILKRCDVIIMIGKWTMSRGAREELNIALSLGMEVIYE